jgi:4'-phosphopantetheinyl transferase
MTTAAPSTWLTRTPLGPWSGPMTDLQRNGFAVTTARVSEWSQHLPAGSALMRLLGSDRDRYAQLPTSLRAQFATTRLMMKQVAAVALCCSPEDIDLGYSLKGKAFVRGQDRAYLSLSHTMDLAAVVISQLGPVGVDVEHSQRDLANPDVTAMMTTPAELAELAQLPPQARQRALLRTWTLKEAYSKALGQGSSFSFTGFGFDVTPESGQAVLRRADNSAVRFPMWDLWSLTLELAPVEGGFVLGLAVPRADSHRGEGQALLGRGGLVHDFLRDDTARAVPSAQQAR